MLYTFLFSILISISTMAQESETPEFAPTPIEVAGAEVVFPTKQELEIKSLYWMCRASSLVRTIKVEMNSGSCKTIYNKDGVDRDSGQSKEISHCFAVFKNIKRNLESNRWSCKDISNAPVVAND